ncbi:MAG: DUF4139 domain-containing protein [Alphaproteobacteria bacterium]|nr:DUF4139 domain-containing protein [Alphaproteobacteria bacterium]
MTAIARLFACFSLVVLGLAASAQAEEQKIPLKSQKSVGLTIYNSDLALVRDTREIRFDRGLQTLAFEGVSARIRPETALLAGEGFSILEQNFDFDLLSPQALLSKSVGETVMLVRRNPATGAETREQATVLSTNSGIVLQIGDRIEVMGSGDNDLDGRLVFDRLPENLRPEPTLSMLLNARAAGRQDVTLSYLTGGLTWKADYVANLSPDETTLSLQGWVTLTNTSGTSYEDAQLQLVAGDVNRVQDRMEDMQMARMSRAPVEQEMAQERLFDYHLYSLGRNTTIANNQTKQVGLLEAPDVTTQKIYETRGQSHYYFRRYTDEMELPVGVFLEIENTEEAGLGKPLPAGVFRVYKQDSQGLAQFIGEDRIDHTPEGEDFRLKMGEAFDVTATRVQKDFSQSARIVGGVKLNEYRSTIEVTVKNATEDEVTVHVHEPMGMNWEVVQQNIEHEKISASIALWKVDVPAKGETVLRYTVLNRDH